jgi:phospholipid/cholesterol/gamma-HCH transport system ATP-binding protein
MSDVLIRASDVSIGWSREAILVEHASFEIRRGEIFGILGRSGCGKSTLFRELVGLEQPLAGVIAWPGGQRPIDDDTSPPAYGVLFQQGALFGSMSVGQNVMLPLERWTDLPVDAVEVIARSKLRLVDLESVWHQSPSTLSGGQMKRVALARALALEPPLLFLDEPSAGLDPITSAGLDRLIATLRDELGLTVVIVTHELGSIFAIVDRCILLDRTSRSIVGTGAPSDLRDSADPRVRAFFQRTAEAA